MFKNKLLRPVPVLVAMLAASMAYGDIHDDLLEQFGRLEKGGSASGEEWFELAQKARTAESVEIAVHALARAAESGFSPVRLAMEEARIEVTRNDPEAAVTALKALSEQGFTGVSFLQNDPLIDSMAGRADYDELIGAMSRQAYPCAHREGFSDFDFWVGEWDVHLANGTYAGSNVIERQERGCVLVERWTSASGGTGMSVNYLDKATDEWVQVWNAEGGSQINIRGGLTDEGMALEGTIHYVANGTTAPFRGLWTPMEDGRVRQYFEQSNDGGETWSPWFEGFYTRRAE